MAVKFALFAGLILAGNWTPDTANARIAFSIKGPFGAVHGKFSGLQADIRFNEKDPQGGSISASIETKTVSTGIGLRNHDLTHKEEWFNSDKYPKISFHSKKMEKTSSGYKATGDLTMKGVTRTVEIPFTFTPNGDAGVFKGRFTIRREDFNLGKSGGSVGSEVTIDLVVPVKKQAPLTPPRQ
jgi:polyisoprenoid-binding protein YceI